MTEQPMCQNGSSTGRALLAPAAAPPQQPGPAFAADAAFLAQLLACRDGAPAYRARRRAEPGDAARRYRAALALVA